MKGGGDQPGQRRGEQGKRREALGEDLGPGEGWEGATRKDGIGKKWESRCRRGTRGRG